MTLAGRETQSATVDRLLREDAVRIICATGPAGAGKTVLMDEALARAKAQGAIVARCAHLPGPDGDGLAPFLGALDDAVSAGLDTLFDPDAGLETLAIALDSGRLVFAGRGSGPLARMAPVGDVAPIAAGAAGARAIAAALVVCRWLLGFGQPLIFQIDDWGRAQGRARDLYALLAVDDDLQGLRILATERDEEPFDSVDTSDIARVRLGHLKPPDQVAILRRLTELDEDEARALAGRAGDMARTPLGLSQVVKAIAAADGFQHHGERCIFDRAVAAACLDASSFETLMSGLIDSEPDASAIGGALVAWNGAATIGDLGFVAERTMARVESVMDRLIAAGVCIRDSASVRFAHDRFFETFQRRTNSQARARYAARVADALLSMHTAPEDPQRGVLMLARRLDAGLDTCPAHPWRDLFARGAARMRALGEVSRAGPFADAAVSLSSPASPPSFTTWRESVFAAIDRSDHETACAHAETARAAAQGPVEAVEADELCTMAYRMSGRLDDAIAAAIRGLARAGVHIPRNPGPLHVVFGLAAALLRAPERYARTPTLSDGDLAMHAPMMRAVNALGSLVYEHNAALAILLASRALPNAVIGATAAGAASQAFLCAEFGAYARAARWARLADTLQDPRQPLRAVARQYASDFGHRYAVPRAKMGRGRPIEALALAEGDLTVAIYSCQHAVFDRLMGDQPLVEAASEARRALGVVERLNDTSTALRIRTMAQVIEQLAQGGAEPWRLADAAEHLAIAAASGLENSERGIALYSAMLAVAYGAYDHARALWRRHAGAFAKSPFHSQSQQWVFLTALARCRMGERAGAVERWLLARACRHNLHDDAHRIAIVRAEHARLDRRRRRALTLYAEAVDQARASGCLLEFGIVAEVACEGASELGEAAAATRFRSAAADAWMRLGANGVARARGHTNANMPASHPRMAPSAEAAEKAAFQLRAEKEDAQRASMAKTRFLATAGHELRTPLQGIIGLLDGADDAQLDLDVLRAGISHLARIVDDLVDTAAADAGALVIRNAPFDAPQALKRVVAEINAANPLAQADLVIAGAPAQRLLGDETRLRQIVSNLVVNALRHGRPPVTVTAAFDVTGKAARLDLDVTDEGPGIALESLARLFEPFEKGDPGSSGLGLGLPLARKLATAMGGTLSCRNRSTGGFASTLSVAFELAALPPDRTANLAPCSILLVEDISLIADTMAAWLRRDGHRVTIARAAPAALARARDTVIDIAIIDRRLEADDDGIVLAENLAHAARPPRNIIIMSASVDAELTRRAKMIGARVVQKPVERRALFELLRPEAQQNAPDPSERETARFADLRAYFEAEQGDLVGQVQAGIERSLIALERCAAANDLRGLKFEAHRLAGLAGHFGLDGVMHAASALEQATTPHDKAMLAEVRSQAALVRWSEFAKHAHAT